MRFADQRAYDAFIARTAAAARAEWLAAPQDGQDRAYELISYAAEDALEDQVGAGAAIAFFNGDPEDLVVGRAAGGRIFAEANARIECDVRDALWKLPGIAPRQGTTNGRPRR